MPVDNPPHVLHFATVRRAVPGDVPWLLDQLRAFALHHPLGARLMGTDDHAGGLLGTLMDTQFLAIAQQGALRVGCIAGMKAPHPFNPALTVATELFWWVAPEHRGSRAGLSLLNAYDDWASDADVVLMTLESASPVHPKTLTKRGYTLAESQFVRVMS